MTPVERACASRQRTSRGGHCKRWLAAARRKSTRLRLRLTGSQGRRTDPNHRRLAAHEHGIEDSRYAGFAMTSTAGAQTGSPLGPTFTFPRHDFPPEQLGHGSDSATPSHSLALDPRPGPLERSNWLP